MDLQSELAEMFATAKRRHREGKLGEAEHLYRVILNRDANHAGAMHLLGLLAMQAGQLEAAEDLIRRAIAMKPEVADPYINLGNLLAQRGKFEQAVAEYRRALAINPGSPEAHNNLGNALRGAGKYEESLACFDKAIALQPDYAGARSNRGNTLRMLGKLEEAVEEYRAALKIEPNNAETISNLGCAFLDQRKFLEAMEELRKAIGLRPNFVKAHASLGITLTDLGRVDEAIAEYRKAVSFGPTNAEAHSNLLMTMHYSTKVEGRELFEEHRRWDQRHARPLAKFIVPHGNVRDAGRRLRVGYISPDFRGHPVSFFFEPILESHDREQVEVFCYSDAMMVDETTDRLRSRADRWREIVRRPHDEVAGIIREDRIDILVELSGHTDSNRLQTMARRPAPVQVTYLGYPDTTGLDAIDYRLTDACADPAGAEELHSEQLVRLSGCAWCYRPAGDGPEVGALPSRKRGHVTFGSFNVLPKINEELMEAWGRILKAMPGSKLVVKTRNMDYEPVRERVWGVFEAFGVARERVELRGSDLSIREHLQRYNEVDVALDPFPYNGTTTTCEALWMGVPVVTLAGERHAGRVGVSLLTNVGLGELVAPTKDRYVEIALALASDVERLANLRAGMRDRVRGSALMDAAGFTRGLEEEYRRMWGAWCGASSSIGGENKS